MDENRKQKFSYNNANNNQDKYISNTNNKDIINKEEVSEEAFEELFIIGFNYKSE